MSRCVSPIDASGKQDKSIHTHAHTHTRTHLQLVQARVIVSPFPMEPPMAFNNVEEKSARSSGFTPSMAERASTTCVCVCVCVCVYE